MWPERSLLDPSSTPRTSGRSRLRIRLIRLIGLIRLIIIRSVIIRSDTQLELFKGDAPEALSPREELLVTPWGGGGGGLGGGLGGG